MAPLVRLVALFALSFASLVLASPHISRHVHARHAIRAPVPVADPLPVLLPKRKRSLNRRCIPRPDNSTSDPVPPSTTSAPVNVAPSPTLQTSSVPSPSTPAYTPASISSTPAYTPPPSTSSTPAYTPPPSTSSTPAYTPAPSTSSTPTYTPPPSTSSAPPPAQTSASSGDSGEPSYMTGTQSGDGTYYDTGLGACGITNNDSQYIAAVSHLLFDTYPGYDGVNPNKNPVCGKTVTASYQGKSVTVTITDRCVGCAITDLDFSPSAFDSLAAASIGRIPITWVWS